MSSSIIVFARKMVLALVYARIILQCWAILLLSLCTHQ